MSGKRGKSDRAPSNFVKPRSQTTKLDTKQFQKSMAETLRLDDSLESDGSGKEMPGLIARQKIGLVDSVKGPEEIDWYSETQKQEVARGEIEAIRRISDHRAVDHACASMTPLSRTTSLPSIGNAERPQNTHPTPEDWDQCSPIKPAPTRPKGASFGQKLKEDTPPKCHPP
jgi:hypothetical protein